MRWLKGALFSMSSVRAIISRPISGYSAHAETQRARGRNEACGAVYWTGQEALIVPLSSHLSVRSTTCLQSARRRLWRACFGCTPCPRPAHPEEEEEEEPHNQSRYQVSHSASQWVDQAGLYDVYRYLGAGGLRVSSHAVDDLVAGAKLDAEPVRVLVAERIGGQASTRHQELRLHCLERDTKHAKDHSHMTPNASMTSTHVL